MADVSEQSQTISDMMSRYLQSVERARSRLTMLAYRNGLQVFKETLRKKSLDPDTTPIQKLTEQPFAKLIEQLGEYAPTTEQLYLQAVKGFYLFADAEGFISVNQSRLKVLMKQRSRRPGARIPLSPMEEIETLLDKIQAVDNLIASGNEKEKIEVIKLRAYRDRAFLLTLADTGLRVHEACSLRRGDMNWKEGYAVIIGKGNKQAVVRFTARSMHALTEYLSLRAALDGNSGKQLSALPLFARHDKGAGKKIKPITPTTGRNIAQERVEQFLGEELVGKITPHTFRHYFVTSVLRGTGNLRYAQELARHENMETTKRYTHITNEELDKAYYEVFEKNSKWMKK